MAEKARRNGLRLRPHFKTYPSVKTGEKLEISIGDAPSCTVVADLSAVDEIRAGHFVFYDLMQFENHVCPVDRIAVAVACPVIAKHKAGKLTPVT